MSLVSAWASNNMLLYQNADRAYHSIIKHGGDAHAGATHRRNDGDARSSTGCNTGCTHASIGRGRARRRRLRRFRRPSAGGRSNNSILAVA